MAGRTPARSSWKSFDKLPPSPLGATPRPHLRQVYPKPLEGTFVSEFELNKSVQSVYGKRTSSTETSYTLLRSQQNSLDTVDAPQTVDYTPLPDDYPPQPAVDMGRSTKSIIILALIFFLSLVAVGMVYVGLSPKSKE